MDLGEPKMEQEFVNAFTDCLRSEMVSGRRCTNQSDIGAIEDYVSSHLVRLPADFTHMARAAVPGTTTC